MVTTPTPAEMPAETAQAPGWSPHLCLWIFLAIHVAAWTLAPALTHRNLPLDVIEQTAWGPHWQLGYFKHPPMAAWLTELFAGLGAGVDWPLYLLAQLIVAGAFWAVWRLASDMLPAVQALVAVLLMEAVVYHNFLSTEFNANTVQFPFWALSVWAFWRAINGGRWWWWALLGAAAAGGMLGKYYTAVLLLPMIGLLAADPQWRVHWRRPGPYVAAAVGLVLLAPHLWWLAAHDFPSFGYAVDRAGGAADGGNWTDRIVYPLKFLADQSVLLVAPVLLLALLSLPRRHPWDRADRFLLWMTAGPFVVACGLSAALGFELRSMWGAPMLLFAGLAGVKWWNPAVDRRRVRRFAAVWAALAVILVAGYWVKVTVGPHVTGRGERVDYPGRIMAQTLTAAWHDRFGRPLTVVVGDVWPAGNLAWYSPDRPTVYSFADPAQAPWIGDDRVRRDGAIVVWTAGSRGEVALPLADSPMAGLRERFPDLEEQPPLALPWQTGDDLVPVQFGWALVAPASHP